MARKRGKARNRRDDDLDFKGPVDDDSDDIDFRPKPVIKSVRFPRQLARKLLAIAQAKKVPFTRVALAFLERQTDAYLERNPIAGPLPDFPESGTRKRRVKRQ